MKTLGLQSLERYRLMLFTWLSVVVIGTLLVFAYQTSKLFIDLMRPDLTAKAVLVSESVAAQFQRAAELGIPLRHLNGVNTFLDDAIDNHPDIAYAVVVVPSQGLMFTTTRFDKDERITQPLRSYVRSDKEPGSVTIGQMIDVTTPLPGLGKDEVFLHVGADANYIQTRLSEIKIDLFITVFVAVVITLEVLVFVMMLTLDRQSRQVRGVVASVGEGNFALASGHAGADSGSRLMQAIRRRLQEVNRRYLALTQSAAPRAGSALPQMLEQLESKFQFSRSVSKPAESVNVQAIRLPLFMYFFATDMSRPFWPNFVGNLASTMTGFDQNMLMALPMAMWGLTMLAITPFGPRLVDALGLRVALLAGMIPTAAGIALCALADSYPTLLLWRCVSAAGFGIVTVTGMLFVTMKAERGKGARSAAIFIGAQTAAGICGTAIGGILADRMGYPATLLVAALITLLNCVLVMQVIAPIRLVPDSAKPQGSARAYGAVARRWRFIAFVPLAALPPRIVLVGFLLYLIPVSLHRLDFSDAAIGRFLMCYFIFNMGFTALAARLLDRTGWHRGVLVAGTGLMGAAIYLFAMHGSVAGIAASMVVLGLGMALATTALASIVPSHFKQECADQGLATVTSLLRMVERIGSMAAPLLVAFLIQLAGHQTGAAVLAFTLSSLSVGLAIYFYLTNVPVPKKGLP